MTEQQYLTVSALTKYIKRKFEADPYLGRVYLTGEISNFRKRPMHQYFSLKDDHAKISAVMFKSAFDKVKFEPTEGMKVLVVGYVSVYEATGAYQINIERMEPDGIGALYQAFEQLKEKLAKEGLFTAPKKAIPRFPKRIAVLTSPSGAVIRDIITTVRRRYPIAQIILYPTVVQGDQAARNIVENLKRADQQNFDTIIIGRGGGSIEDLWPFNEEVVARQIFATHTPIISSVGHETDTTIADYVADMRAPTPTAAAELAVPVLTEEVLKINQLQMRFVQAFQAQLQTKAHQLDRLLQSYIFTQPQRLYEAKVLQLDQLQQQLNIQLQSMLREKEKDYQLLAQRLNQQTPIYRLQAEGQKLDYLYERLNQATNRIYQQKLQTFQHLVASLDLLSPLKIMQRGYSYTTSEEIVVKSVKQLALNQTLTIHYADGKVQSKVEKIQEDK